MRGGSALVIALIVILVIVAVAIVFMSTLGTKHLRTFLGNLSLRSNASVTTSVIIKPPKVGPNDVFIAILVDNDPYAPGLKTAWGISVYVEAYGRRILFDTGPSPDVLKYNSEKLGIDLSKLDAVVISHEHGDHVGGLPYVAKVAGKVLTYIPQGATLALWNMVARLGLKPVVVTSSTEIFPDIYVIGPLYGPPAEEALAINTKYGLVIIVGCSHPGVVNFVRKAMEVTHEKPYIVIGGFHLIGEEHSKVREVADELVSLGVKKICPTHCSGEYIKEYLREKYPNIYLRCGVGYELLLKNVRP